MKIIIVISLIAILNIPSSEISMLGIKIGDGQKSLNKINLKVDSNGDGMKKIKTNNGNDFSVTCQNSKVVYMENDWLHDIKSRKPLYSDFTFGVTSLRDIRKKFGTNGFTYESRQAFKVEDNVIEFNCFEFDSPNNEILVTVTKVAISTNLTEDNVADSLKLDALIIADKSYCDKEWGKEKLFDKNYKKIKP